MAKTSIALVTCQQFPEMYADDHLLIRELQQRQAQVLPVIWNDPQVDWGKFCSIVIRSPWDYCPQAEQYARWLTDREAEGHRVFNAPDAVLANIHKRYLLDFSSKGIPIVPTVLEPKGSRRILADLFRETGWNNVVIKPAVSSGADGTWRASDPLDPEVAIRFAMQLRGADLLVQPFLPEIESPGEYSLLFFDGEFSHAVLKRPAPQDFRVQIQHGGITQRIDPPPAMIEQARSVLRMVPQPLLYARVDGIERDGQFLLMELEINEPLLFLSYDQAAASRFADAIMRWSMP